MLFQTPPPAAATQIVFAWPASTTTSVRRPPMSVGPRSVHVPPETGTASACLSARRYISVVTCLPELSFRAMYRAGPSGLSTCGMLVLTALGVVDVPIAAAIAAVSATSPPAASMRGRVKADLLPWKYNNDDPRRRSRDSRHEAEREPPREILPR